MDKSIKEISYNLQGIDEAANAVWPMMENEHTIIFSGDMGAGKTTLIHAICDMLGVRDAVSSPTFALINEYHYNKDGQDKTIYHMDWYRLRDAAEAINAGMEDTVLRAIKNGYHCFIEWPEKAPEILPARYLKAEITLTGENERKLNLYLHA
jgi:tRNA threonylcarbamoyladenosine biosynthesis protein TsaE